MKNTTGSTIRRENQTHKENTRTEDEQNGIKSENVMSFKYVNKLRAIFRTLSHNSP